MQHSFLNSHDMRRLLVLPMLAWLSMSGVAHATQAVALAGSLPIDPVPPFVISPEYTENASASEEVLESSLTSPFFIALFGDSVSLATMADAKFGNPGPRFYADFLGSGALASLYQKVVAPHKPDLSDEEQHELIHNLFGNMARKYLSPYLGTQAYSLPVLFAETTGKSPKVYNGAQLAGSYYFGKIYLDKFERFFERNPFHKRPELIIVNFNGMDFIENRGPAVYAAKIREFYTRLTALAPYSKIVVTGIGDPVELLTYPDRVAVSRSPTGPIKCSDLYKFLRFGNGLGLYPGAPQSQIDSARATLAILRGILENEVTLMNNDRTIYPDFKGQVVYVKPDDGEGGLSPEMIAADCIHPNQEAQSLIGQKMWKVIEPLL